MIFSVINSRDSVTSRSFSGLSNRREITTRASWCRSLRHNHLGDSTRKGTNAAVPTANAAWNANGKRQLLCARISGCRVSDSRAKDSHFVIRDIGEAEVHPIRKHKSKHKTCQLECNEPSSDFRSACFAMPHGYSGPRRPSVLFTSATSLRTTQKTATQSGSGADATGFAPGSSTHVLTPIPNPEITLPMII